RSMPARKPKTTTSTSKPAIPDITDPTLLDVFLWVKNLYTKMEELDRSNTQLLLFLHDDVNIRSLARRVAQLEDKVEVMTNTMINLVRRLQTVIEMKQKT